MMGLFHLPEKGISRIFLFLSGILLCTGVSFLFFRFLLKPLLPFLLAGVLAYILQKPLDTLDRLTGHHPPLRRFFSVLLVCLAAGLCLSAVIFIGNTLFEEAGTFFSWVFENLGRIRTRMEMWLWDVRGRFLPGKTGGRSLFLDLLESADAVFLELLQGAAASFTANLPKTLSAVIGTLPQAVLFLAVTVIASVYLTMDYPRIRTALSELLPQKLSEVLRGIRGAAASSLMIYGRACALLLLLTGAELYLGFLLLGLPYAFGLAVLIAVIDILPVLGTGTVLLPWAGIELLCGNLKTGIGLLVLYLVISVVRQILEPKLIGKNIGLHPLAALFSMYCGFRLFGFPGLLLLPPVLSVIWKYREQNRMSQEEKQSPA